MYTCDRRGCTFQTNDLRALVRHANNDHGLQHQLEQDKRAEHDSGLRLTNAGLMAALGIGGRREGRG